MHKFFFLLTSILLMACASAHCDSSTTLEPLALPLTGGPGTTSLALPTSQARAGVQVVPGGVIVGKDGESPLVVVSKTPELYTYVLTGLSFLVGVITLVSAGSIFLGARSSAKAHKEAVECKKVAEDYRIELNKSTAALEAFVSHKKTEIENFANVVAEAIEQRQYRALEVRQQKTELLGLLAETPADVDRCYQLLTAVLEYPDRQSLDVFARCLERFPGNEDISRAVRNGLRAYERLTEDRTR